MLGEFRIVVIGMTCNERFSLVRYSRIPAFITERIAIILRHLLILSKVQPMAVSLGALARANLGEVKLVEIVRAAVIGPDPGQRVATGLHRFLSGMLLGAAARHQPERRRPHAEPAPPLPSCADILGRQRLTDDRGILD